MVGYVNPSSTSIPSSIHQDRSTTTHQHQLIVSPVWYHKGPLRRRNLPAPLFRFSLQLQAHRHHSQNQCNQASYLASHHLPHQRPRDRCLRPCSRRCILPWRRHKRLLYVTSKSEMHLSHTDSMPQLSLPLLFDRWPLRSQERYPGPGSLLWYWMPGRLRKVQLDEQAC